MLGSAEPVDTKHEGIMPRSAISGRLKFPCLTCDGHRIFKSIKPNSLLRPFLGKKKEANIPKGKGG